MTFILKNKLNPGSTLLVPVTGEGGGTKQSRDSARAPLALLALLASSILFQPFIIQWGKQT